jgi:RNA 2',3'-cyclic 3'-phosphodiesterase
MMQQQQTSGGDRIRTFVAIPIPEEIHRIIDELIPLLKRAGIKAKWVPEENRHLTMAFLGDIAADRVPDVCGCTANVARLFTPMRLILKGVGVFPAIQRARVIWVGIQEDDHLLNEFYGKLQSGLGTIEGLGYTPESRAFKPHLTIGRFNKPMEPRELWTAVDSQKAFSTPAFFVHQAVVYRSELKSSGAVYTVQGSAPFSRTV